MPIGVPRIIYSWGEELPAQWTDIYNFIFRRRMVFLMQYLDVELCNQICGLLINIHMEDRSQELMTQNSTDKQQMSIEENQTQSNDTKKMKTNEINTSTSIRKPRSIEDLLNTDEDLSINDVNTLEQLTLQRMTTDWLNWNSQFYDYSNEPYLYYLSELLSQDFRKNTVDIPYNKATSANVKNILNSDFTGFEKEKTKPKLHSNLDIYSTFRNQSIGHNETSYKTNFSNKYLKSQLPVKNWGYNNRNATKTTKNHAFYKLLCELTQHDYLDKLTDSSTLSKLSQKSLSQRALRSQFNKISYKDRSSMNLKNPKNAKIWNLATKDSPNDARDYYRKQTERTFLEEESKKVFVIINSFGGGVANGITVHDALQFIKAGSLTLGLGVAASASSLVLAGGTIGDRYVTEACHTMIHQPFSEISGQASDIWIDSQEIMKIRLDVADIYSLSTYRPRHKILRDLDRDFYLTASETVAYGLADNIASNEVMSEIIDLTNKVWDYHDSKQQRLLETRESASAGQHTQTQN